MKKLKSRPLLSATAGLASFVATGCVVTSGNLMAAPRACPYPQVRSHATHECVAECEPGTEEGYSVEEGYLGGVCIPVVVDAGADASADASTQVDASPSTDASTGAPTEGGP